MIKQYFKNKQLKSLTRRKLFGKYFHMLVKHAPTQYRIVSGRSINVENEERIFHDLKTHATLSSNHHPENVILNNIIRMQAVDQNTKSMCTERKNKAINNMYQQLKKYQKNTIFSFADIVTHERLYQAHLERIADYLCEGKWWEETKQGLI